MFRPNTTVRFYVIPVLILAAMVMVSCGAGADEKTLLDKYFRASKMQDNLTLANIATVAFDPKIDGQMQSFSVISSSEEQVTALELKADGETLRKAQAEEKDLAKKMKEYQDANEAAVDRIVKAEQKNQTLKGKDAEIQKEWSRFREETSAFAKKLSALKQKANLHRPIVEISAQDQSNPIDVTAYDCDLVTKDVTIEGRVKPETGDIVTKKFMLTLKRATVKAVNGKDMVGRWVITDLKDVGK
jgi:hypothetical protein